MTPRALRDRDSAVDAQRLKAALWAVVPGTLAAIVGAVYASVHGGSPVLWAMIAFTVVTGGGWLLWHWLGDRAGNAVASLYAPGSTIAAPAEYSFAESLVIRGRLDEAAEQYRRLAEERPNDAEPRIRLARLLRDDLARPADALRSFSAALDVPDIEPGTEALVLREATELCRRMGEPRRALPSLARVAARRPDTNTAAWARRAIAEIRAEGEP